jgi:ATP-dependent helicase/nuclease subunit A
VRDALAPDAVRTDDGEDAALRWDRSGSTAELSTSSSTARIDATSDQTLPNWLRKDIAPFASGPSLINPSSAHPARPSRPNAAAQASRLRGRLLHRLLQSIPEVAPERRAEAAHRFLSANGALLPQDERDRLLTRALQVIAEPAFAELFAPGSRAEVPIAAALQRADGKTVRVSGQIDRLAITNDTVLIADYKTDADTQLALPELPPRYVTQLALYAAALRQVYPGKAVRSAILWTALPALVEVPESMIEAALAEALSSQEEQAGVSAA